jgi:MYXO-CTERM domain-containing protein
MKNSKVLALTAGMGSLIIAGAASADFQGISHEVEVTAFGTMVQVYVDVEAGDQLNAVYGDADNALHIGAGAGSFYQNAFGGPTVAGMNPAFFPIFPSLVYDSFVTIGLTTNVGNAMLDIGIDFSDFNAGGAIDTDNGSWFATPDDAQVHEIDGRVLIGQFTLVDGALEGNVNLQGKNADGSNWTALGVDVNPVPAPGAIALLGLAGVAARRRRK